MRCPHTTLHAWHSHRQAEFQRSRSSQDLQVGGFAKNSRPILKLAFIASTIASHSTAVAICTSSGCVMCLPAQRYVVKNGLVESAQSTLLFDVDVGQ